MSKKITKNIIFILMMSIIFLSNLIMPIKAYTLQIGDSAMLYKDKELPRFSTIQIKPEL